MFYPFKEFITKFYIVISRYILISITEHVLTFLILPVVLYGCETWPLTLREERKLKVSVNMVLRRIFGPRRDKIT